jgi:hypothetical protein
LDFNREAVASDFDEHSGAHRRRLRPNRGPLNDPREDLDCVNRDATDALLNRATTEIILPLPFIRDLANVVCIREKEILFSSI